MDSARAATVREIPSEDDFKTQIKSASAETLLVIYFHAPWAQPCQQMSTVLSTLASTYTVESPPSIDFLSINAEDLPEVSEDYDVTAVPYIVLQKAGKRLETVSGSDATKVRDAVERHAGKSGNPGKLGLPPAQTVTKKDPHPSTIPNGATASETGDGSAKDLSSYAPTSNDPQTAPAYSSGEQPSKEELFKRLDGLVKAAPVMLFMKGTPSAPQCGFSRQTVSLLREKGIRYGFFNILADDEVRQGLKEYGDWPTFPQLWVGGELVGGLDIVRAASLPLKVYANSTFQVKDEFADNADFLNEYSVSSARNSGGPAAAEAQAQPA